MMTEEEALVLVERLLFPEPFTKVQQNILRQVWQEEPYRKIAQTLGYNEGVIRNLGSEIWHALGAALGTQVTKKSLKLVLNQHQARQQQLHPILVDLGEAIDVSFFYGREKELDILSRWIVHDGCRLIAILGPGGIGKTALSVKLSQELQEQFQCLVWRSLRDLPPLPDFLTSLIKLFSRQPVTQFASTNFGKITQLLELFRLHRCLLVLDNFEAILQTGSLAGSYRSDHEDYGELLRRIGETQHQSCLVLTSREKPAEVSILQGDSLPVRSYELTGLEPENGRQILKSKGLTGTEAEIAQLMDCYQGNPLALKIAATTIQDLFNGRIAAFFVEKKTLSPGIHELLEQQFARLSLAEQHILYWLAINREPLTLSELQADVVLELGHPALVTILSSLRCRSLIEKAAADGIPTNSIGFSLQPVIMEYVTEQFVEQLTEEFGQRQFSLFNSHALIKAQAKEYIRESQFRMILLPLLERLHLVLSSQGLLNFTEDQQPSAITQLTQNVLQQARQQNLCLENYGPGNLLNLLASGQTELTGLDFSGLEIRQAYLVNANLQQVNFAHAKFRDCVFTQSFAAVTWISFSPDGRLLATSHGNGDIYLWDGKTGNFRLSYRGHTNWIRTVNFSPDGRWLLSASDDLTLRLWNVEDGTCTRIFDEGIYCIRAVFHPDGQRIAAACADHRVRIWDLATGECLSQFIGHQQWVMMVNFSPNGQQLVSSSADHTVRVWDVATGECLQVLKGHQEWVIPVVYSPDGQWIASAGIDCTVRLWDVDTGKCLQILQGHTGWIWSLAFSPDGQFLVSAGDDQTIRFWNPQDGSCQQVLQGHRDLIWSLAFHPDGQLLVSGSDDQTIRFWNWRDGKCWRIIGGYTNWVRSLAFTADDSQLVAAYKDAQLRIWDLQNRKCLTTLSGHRGPLLAVSCHPQLPLIVSGGEDRTVKIWDWKAHTCRTIQAAHTDFIWAVAYSPDGSCFASAGAANDPTIKLWDSQEGVCLQTLTGHQNRILNLVFHPQGYLLASASEDLTVKIWNLERGCCVHSLNHNNRAIAVSFAPQEQTIASGGMDSLISLWDVDTGELRQTLSGHTGWIFSLVYSPCGRWLYSSSSDRTIRVWDLESNTCKQVLEGHTDWIWAITLSQDGQLLASASADETLKLWDLQTLTCVATLRAARPYEGMNITGADGITPTQKQTLKLLGAIEVSEAFNL